MSGSGATHESFIQRYLSKPPSPATQRHSGKRSSDQGLRNSLKLNGSNDMSMSYSRTPESQNVLDRISTFCSEDNLLQRASFLDQELSVFGYPSLLSEVQHKNSSSGHSKQHLDLISLVNITYDLMQCWKHSIESQNDASDLQRMTESESARFRHMVSRLKEDLAAKDRDLKSKELMHLQMNQRIESLKKKLKIEQEKGKRLSSELTMRDTQFRHEKKKKMQEIERLQARLQQLLQDKRQERILGIEILNSLQRADGKRGKWNTDKTKKSDEQDMYRLIILNYEDAQKHLLKENESMRKYLKEMQGELISALNEKNTLSGSQEQNNLPLSSKLDRNGEGTASTRSSSAASNETDGSEVSEPMSDGMFEMPYDLVKNDIEKSIRSKWRTLKKEIRKTRMKESNPEQPKTVESFNDNDYEDLVQQQQELIDYLTTANNDEGTERPIPEDCYFLEEKAEFEKQKNMFSQQQSAFEKERKLYADALIQLEDQKQDFESEKNKWLQQNFLQLTPFRGDSKTIGTFSPLKNLKGNERKSRQSQSFKPRRSASPDRSTLKRTEQSKNFHNQSHLEKISPNTISHTLSRLHSSSHQNSFSPDNQLHRSPDVAWQDPSESQRGHAHKAKSSPATSADVGGMLPPSTAELYRSLGLVYYGNDKENVEMTENRNRLPAHHEKRITSTSKAEHQRNIKRYHHLIRTSPNGMLKHSPPALEKGVSVNCSSIRRSYDSSYTDRTVISVAESPRNHKRSLSAPKESQLNSSAGKYPRNPDEDVCNGSTDSPDVDTVLTVDSIEQQKTSRERFVVVEDLKAALFQD